MKKFLVTGLVLGLACSAFANSPASLKSNDFNQAKAGSAVSGVQASSDLSNTRGEAELVEKTYVTEETQVMGSFWAELEIAELKSQDLPVPANLYRAVREYYGLPDFDLPLDRQGGETIATATVITALPHNSTGTTLGFIDDYDEVCPYSGSTSPDVVYSFTPAVNIGVDITLCNGSDYDTKLYVYENAHTPGAPFACNDDACPGYVSEILDLPLTGGNTYYIVVDGYYGAAGNYVLDITEDVYVEPPVNDQCVDAIAINAPYPVQTSGTVAGATADCPGWNGVWYTIELPYAANNVYVDFCDDPEIWDNMGIVLSTDCACTSYYYASFAPTCVNGNMELFYGGVTGPGIIYLPLFVEDYEGLAFDFTFNVFVEEFVIDPVGNTCDLPIVAPALPYTFNGTTADNTQSYGNAAPDEWHEFTLADAAQVIITLCEPDMTTYDSYLYLLSGDCATELASNDDFCGLVSEITAFLDPGTFVVGVDGYSSNAGDYQLDIAVVEPCDVVCPGGTPEGEEDCYDEYVDITNGGCNSVPPVFGAIASGETICGTGGDFLFEGSQYRDTDWFLFELTETMTVTVTGEAEFPPVFAIVNDVIDCIAPDFVEYVVGGECEVMTFSANMYPGSYAVFVGTNFDGYPCGLEYWVYMEAVPWTPPVAPPNDLCEDAQPIVAPYPVQVAGTVAGATIDCSGLLDWNAVWYTIELPYAENNVFVNWCDTECAPSNYGIILMDDCACDDYIPGTYAWSCPNGNLELEWLAVPGPTTIYFPHYIEGCEDFIINVDVQEATPYVPQLDCSQAVPVACDDLVSGDTSLGVNNVEIYSCSGWTESGPELVYTLDIGDGYGSISATLSNMSADMDVFILSDCNEMECVGYGDSVASYASPPAGTYYIVVDGYMGAMGTFDLAIGCQEPVQMPECPEGTLFGQTPIAPEDPNANGYTSSGTYISADNYFVSEDICDIHWWGFAVGCPDPTPFQIDFYADAGGYPAATASYTYNVVATPVGTGLIYFGAYELYYYSVELLDPCVPMHEGWISIYQPECTWYWSTAYGEAPLGWQSSVYPPDWVNAVQIPTDLAFCLTPTSEVPCNAPDVSITYNSGIAALTLAGGDGDSFNIYKSSEPYTGFVLLDTIPNDVGDDVWVDGEVGRYFYQVTSNCQ